MRVFQHGRYGPIFAVLLAACGSTPDNSARVASLDEELTGANASAPARDPALLAALHDQIMVDPQLVQQANTDAVRPPPRPVSGALPPDDIAAQPGPAETETLRPAPAAVGECRQCAAARQALTLGALAQKTGASGECSAKIAYSAAWSTRLPPGIALYPDARVSEAAGADGKTCRLRVVSFSSSAPPQRLLDWYYTHSKAVGYSAEHGASGGEHTLGGTKPGGAFLLVLRPRAGETDADLMADGGS